jgi:hypothetical protein
MRQGNVDLRRHVFITAVLTISALVATVLVPMEPPGASSQDGDALDETTVARWETSEDVVVLLLEYTWGGGESWDIVAASWTEQTYTFDPDHLPASTGEDASRFRVTASNGPMSTTAVSGGFTVTEKHPAVGHTGTR